MPAGLTYDSHTISSDGLGTSLNSGGTYDSATGEWDIGKISVGETMTLVLNFTVDADTGGTTITNTISEDDIQSLNTDPTDNHVSLSASITIDRLDIEAVDDTIPAFDGAVGTTTANIVANDTLGTTTGPVIGTDVNLAVSGTAQDGTTALGLNQHPSERQHHAGCGHGRDHHRQWHHGRQLTPIAIEICDAC